MPPEAEHDKLQTAINSLAIQRVLLNSALVKPGENFKPGFTGGQYANQMRHRVVSVEIMETELEDADSTIKFVRYKVQLGFRLIGDGSPVDPVAAPADAPMAFEVAAEFSADYLLKEECDSACLEEFGDKNVIFHVWPYWREYVHSVFMRAGLPPVEIPFFIANKK